MKKLCVFVFSVVMIFNLSANEHNFSIGMGLGSLNGQAQEIVYRDSSSEDKLSELLWNFNSLAYLGLDIKYSWLKPENGWGLFANGSFKYGFLSPPGVMEDHDWLGIKEPDWLTNYSVHDNKTESANLLDFNLGASFLISQKFLLKSYISYHYMYFSFTASGGSILYPMSEDIYGKPVDGHGYIIPQSTVVCTYEQTWHIFSPAISFYGEFNRYFDIEIAFEATPFIWCLAKDEHPLRQYGGLEVTDSLAGGIFIEPSFLFSYKPSDYFVLSLSFAYREINNSRGNTKEKFKNQPSASFYKNISGAGYTATDIGIIAKYKF